MFVFKEHIIDIDSSALLCLSRSLGSEAGLSWSYLLSDRGIDEDPSTDVLFISYSCLPWTWGRQRMRGYFIVGNCQSEQPLQYMIWDAFTVSTASVLGSLNIRRK